MRLQQNFLSTQIQNASNYVKLLTMRIVHAMTIQATLLSTLRPRAVSPPKNMLSTKLLLGWHIPSLEAMLVTIFVLYFQ